MAKRTKKVKRVPVRVPRRVGGLDQAGLAYARLLADPCNASLTHSVYGGADGTIIVKFQKYLSLDVGAGTTAGYVQWTPGVANTSGTDVLIGRGDSASSSVAAAAIGGPASGDAGWLVFNAAAVRCIAGCMEVMYTGTELNRSGVVAVGNVSGSMLVEGGTTSVNSLKTVCQETFRMPDRQVSVKWQPSSNDLLWHDPSRPASGTELERKGSILMTWDGLNKDLVNPLQMSARLTAVYEIRPNMTFGMTTPPPPIVSRNDLTEVLSYLRSIGFRWIGNMVMGTAVNYMRMRNSSGAARIEL